MTVVVKGQQVYSKTRTHDDGFGDMPGHPVGGIIIDRWETEWPDTGEIVDQVRVVEAWREQIDYHTLNVDDLDVSMSAGVRKDVLRSMSTRLHSDMARHPSHDHLPALLAMSLAMNTTTGIVS